MSETPAHRSTRYVYVARALALAAGVGAGAAACGGPPDVPGFQVVASSRGGYCVCCPSGDQSGECHSYLGPGDGSVTLGPTMAPPTGQRWCADADQVTEAGMRVQPSCPVAGPLPPPELA